MCSMLDITSNKYFIKIAYQRYIDALFNGDADNRITISITCLEALLLKGAERTELSHKLAQRVAMILKLCGISAPIKVYKEVKQAYDVRSTYIHGSFLTENQRRDIKSLEYSILNYARIVLSIYIQIWEKFNNKDDFVMKIDNAMLDDTAKQRLCSILDEVITGL